MSRSWAALLAWVLVLAVPFVARSRRVVTPQAAREPATGVSERLVVLTPHNEAVRFEFGRAFRDHMAEQGRDVVVDWRTPGATAEIARFLASAYTAAFERHWTVRLGRPWSARVATGFMAPASVAPGAPPGDEVAEARRAFLTSDVGSGIDLFFGGGSNEHAKHAEAGRLVDAGLIARHPEFFGPAAIPHQIGGRTYWDRGGRWMGTCLSTFGICFNRDVLARLGVPPPRSWAALTDGRLHGQVALSDPTKSGSIAKVFETVVQAEMHRATAEAGDASGDGRVAVEAGWARAMRLIRRIGGNARYFTDASSKIPLDVATGDAAAGMCIDYYGRFQSETLADLGAPLRVGFVAPPGETATDADPIGLLRGAPHKELAIAFIEFVISEAGQKLWAFRRGTPGGPERYALRRLPILPRLYDAAFEAQRSDPTENPYSETSQLPYREAWTGHMMGAMSFVIRAMCVDTETELQGAYAALVAAGFPPRATAAFDDVSLVDYVTVSGPIRAALKATDPLAEAAWSRRLGRHFRDLYARVETLAREGQ